MSRKALVISGGGAKGAWGVGLLKALTEQGNSWDTVVGTSTGALMGPLILANRINELESAYTNVTQSDIFNVNPFKKDSADIKFWNAVGRLISRKRTLGESEPLKELILKFFKVGDYNRFHKTDKLFGASVANLKTGKGEVKTWDKYSYLEMVNWIWASANNQIFMSHYDAEGTTWADGGLNNYAHISWVINNTPDLEHIDVIIHNQREPLKQEFAPESGIFARLLRVIDILTAEIIRSDLREAELSIQIQKNINMNVYYMKPEDIDIIGENSLNFNKEAMTSLLHKAYTDAHSSDIDVDKCFIDKSTNRICLYHPGPDMV